MKAKVLLWIFALLVLCSFACAGVTDTVIDGFDRTTSNTVGNGWAENESDSMLIGINGSHVILNQTKDEKVWISKNYTINLTNTFNITWNNYTITKSDGSDYNAAACFGVFNNGSYGLFSTKGSGFGACIPSATSFMNVVRFYHDGSIIKTHSESELVVKNGTWDVNLYYNGSTAFLNYWNKTSNMGDKVVTVNVSGLAVGGESGNSIIVERARGGTGGGNLTVDSITFENLTNTLTMDFYYASNSSVFSPDEVTIDLIGNNGVYTFNYTTITGTKTITSLPSADYTIRYNADGYSLNEYQFNATVNYFDETLSLYLINETSQLTITVYDTVTLNPIQGAIVYMQKYYPSEGVFKTIGSYETDAVGKAYFWYEQGTEYYKFLVDYPLGERKLTTRKAYIQSSSLNLYISLLQDVAEPYFKEENVTYTLTGSNVTYTFTATWTDNTNQFTQFCLYVKEYGYYGKTVLNTTCTAASSGSIELGFPTINKTYYALFTGTYRGIERNIATNWIELVQDEIHTGAQGLFYVALFIMVFSFISYLHIYALLAADLGLFMGKLMHLIDISWGMVITIFIASLMIALIIEMKKQ